MDDEQMMIRARNAIARALGGDVAKTGKLVRVGQTRFDR